MKKTIIYLFVIWAFFPACSTIKTIAPVKKEEIPVISLKPSYISLPIELDVKDLEKKINIELKGLLYNDDSFTEDNIKVKAWKKEDFTMSINGNELYYKVPLKLSVIYKKFIEFPEVFADITLEFKTKFSINKDWSFSTKTTSLGFDTVNTPIIKVAGMEFPIKNIADIILLAKKETIGNKIDNSIKNYSGFRTYAQEAWALIHKPVVVNENPKLWLKMAPAELSAVQITGENGKINMAVAIKSTNEILFGDEVPYYSENIFPDLNIVPKLKSEFAINLNVDIPFEKLYELASKEILGKTFNTDKKTVKINDFKIYNSGEFFVIELMLDGSIKGNIYLKGKPVYNDKEKAVEIKDLEFDIDTKDKLLKSADWLLHDGFVKLIEQKLKYSINDKLEEAKKLAQDNFKENHNIKGVVLRGEIENITVDKIYIIPNAIKAIVLFQGKLAVSIDGISKM